MTSVDLLIVGAGPSGMAAAIAARRHGLEVMVVDEQAAVGGQIWRSVEAGSRRDEILGPSYVEGRPVAEAFRACGAWYRPLTKLWQIEPGLRAFLSAAGRSEAVDARRVIFATGAQERPAPFPGWTLPGVLTVGAAQILLKSSGQIPVGPVWIAGSGPLPLLYAHQLLSAGGTIAGFLDTTPRGQWRRAIAHLPGALRAPGELLKGLKWLVELRGGATRFVSGVTEVEALGPGQVSQVRFRAPGGPLETVDAATLLVHEGVIPSIHPLVALNCQTQWDDPQQCFTPVVDPWGETSRAGVFVAGDGARIGGARAALLTGELAALRVAGQLGRLGEDALTSVAAPLRQSLRHELAMRPFLDALYAPRREVFEPADRTMVCRCEEVTAGEIRDLARLGTPGPGQTKAATRAGMGPCQGRQCGYTVTRLLGAVQNRHPADVGYLRIRPPLKPLTLSELASLNEAAPSKRSEFDEE